MILAADVQYDESSDSAQIAGVVFEDWADGQATNEYVLSLRGIAPYVPGQFYRRELPCLLALMEQVTEPIDLFVVDGYVQLGDKPGLGMHLWEAVNGRFPVVGIAKSYFHESQAEQVLRGRSKQPLYVTAVGQDVQEVAEKVQEMHGPYRIPTLLKRVDKLARKKPD